jgi:hypothetical protein
MWHGHPGWLSQADMHKRAGGRKHHNAVARFRRLYRLHTLTQLLAAGVWSQGELARRLHVHQSTISKDMKFLETLCPEQCPRCGCTCKRLPRPRQQAQEEAGAAP